MMSETRLSITDEEFDAINQALVSRYGIDFTGYEISSLKRRITRIIHKYDLQSSIGLWQKLLYDPGFAITFKDEVSVGLTEMFRNPDLWIYLRDNYLLKFLGQKDISILHAGCSTGEEFYTMAITLHEYGFLYQTKFDVVDLSTRFVQLTQAGVYDKDVIDTYSKNYKEFNPSGDFKSYFNEEESTYTAKEFLKKNADFRQFNLVSDTIEKQYDIIFCRNVMIYFNDPLKMIVLEKFSKALKSNGVLVIGYFDALPQDYVRFFDYYSPSFKIFKKI